MKAFRTVFVVIVVALLAAAFAPLPGAQRVAASNTTVALGTPAQSFVQSALGLPLLSPMTFSASAPVIRITSETLAVPNYACKLTAQTPADWTKMASRQSFDAKWTLLNTGAKTWYKTAVDYKYLSGTKIHTNASIYDLPWIVPPGKKVNIAVDMEAPKYNGYYSWYTTTWGLAMGSQVFCRFSMTIVVNR
jgi:hypothetical protein